MALLRRLHGGGGGSVLDLLREPRTFPFGELETAETLTAVLALVAALLWGSSTVLGCFVLSDVPFYPLTGARLLLGLPLLGIIVAARGSLEEVQTGFAVDPARLVLLALIPSLLGLLLYYRGLAGTRASLAALAELAFPATAIALNWVVLVVGVSANQVAGFLLLWVAVLVLGYLNSRTTAPEPRPANAGARRGN